MRIFLISRKLRALKLKNCTIQFRLVRKYSNLQIDEYETDPYILQIFQSNTPVFFDYFRVL